MEPADSKYSRDLAQSLAEDDEDEPLLESQRLHLKAKVPLIDAPPKILAPRRSNRVINSGCKRQLSSEPNSQEALSCELPSPVNSTTSSGISPQLDRGAALVSSDPSSSIVNSIPSQEALQSSSASHASQVTHVNTIEASPTSISRNAQTARPSSFRKPFTRTSSYHHSFTHRPPMATGAPNLPLTTANPKGINLAGLFNYAPSSTRMQGALSTSKLSSRGGFWGLHL